MNRIPILILLLAVAGLAFGLRRDRTQAGAALDAILEAPAIAGKLVVSTYGEQPREGRPRAHTTVFVNGPQYSGMQDNDLRGFLDGTFKWGWNQPGQSHVRVGRRDKGPRYGEMELFRVIQRWDEIDLPPLARVVEARLTLGVEAGTDQALRLMLYEVKKDWNPGRGGVLQDNASPPAPGEVWWNDRAYQEAAWGLPGAGFASDHHPQADTAAMPLVETRYEPGDAEIEFSSPELAAYATRRTSGGLPLLLMIKVSDYQEDLPGSRLELFSAENGDSRNPARRPRLTLEWESAAEVTSIEQPVLLEFGRSYVLPRTETRGARRLDVSFEPQGGDRRPTPLVRGGRGDDASDWRAVGAGLDVAWEWFEVKLIAADDPVTLGLPFVAEFRDTWVRTAPPENQEVDWIFVAPSGTRHAVRAAYAGDYTWRIEFVPDEIGPWRYSWRHAFTKKGYRSTPGGFDVLAGDADNVRARLRALADRIRATDPAALENLERSLMVELTRLERAALLLETPESFRHESGAEVRLLLNDVRALLGRPAPDPIPLVPSPPPAWRDS